VALAALVESSSSMSGVEFSTLFLAEALRDTDTPCLVICPTPGQLPDRCRALQIRSMVVPQPRLPTTSVRVGSRHVANPLAWLAGPPALLVGARRLAQALKESRVDLVCTKGLPAHFYGGLAARRAGLPCVWHLQDLVSPRAGCLHVLVQGLAGRVLADQVIADGSGIVRQMAPFLPRERLTLIHNGVDTAVFTPWVDGSSVRREWNVGASSVVIGSVARLTPWKGQDVLLRAFAMVIADVPEAVLVLVGTPLFTSDRFERYLRALAVELGVADRVIFAGFRDDLPQVLAALDVFAHAAIEKDTSPLAVVSAMASGKAIVTTDIAGVAELFVRDREAILVEPGSPGAMARALRRVVVDVEERRSLGAAARRKAETTLSLPTFAGRCADVFRAALRGRR
jgi:glycosyltransferase involved in cell wall biosynthesis